ncbi:MAG: methylated-DNA--[protein]-cysteine S-methyltransferase [Terriglobia bacterium]
MEALYRTRFDTPLGPMIAVAGENGLCILEFYEPARVAGFEDRLQRLYSEYRLIDKSHLVFKKPGKWLKHYFGGKFPLLSPLALDLRGTDFEIRVWNMLLQIPLGRTVSYSELAIALGQSNKARAVGAAVGHNPISIIVPCHRVVGANGSLTGYGGGLDRKRWLLSHEGSMPKELPFAGTIFQTMT